MSRYIDAEKLINKLEPVVKSAAFKNRNIRSNVNKCWEIVNDQPTADVRENVRGEWIDRGKDMMIRWQCSECGRKDMHIYNFCPNCGAEMRERREDGEIH